MGTASIAMGIADIAFIVIGVVVALVVLAASPLTRRSGDAVARASRTETGVDMNRQFKRPGNEGDLL
jgi:hypothetical protein